MNIKISLILFVILISGCKSWNIQITRPGYDPGYHKQYPRLPHAFALVKNPHPVRYGEKSERFEVRDGDCGDSDCYNPFYRSEISIKKRKIKARFGEDIWYGWSFYNYNISECSLNELKDHLRANGGDGTTEDGKSVYRQVIANVVPLGIGLTESPAADVKGIATMGEKILPVLEEEKAENQEEPEEVVFEENSILQRAAGENLEYVSIKIHRSK